LSYLVDTNIVSELRKKRRCDPGVAAWFAHVLSEEIYLSALTLGEIRKGIESLRRRDETSAGVLDRWLHELAVAYAGRILPVDQAVAEQ